MDTSKQNILMCEKAVEIQASWKIADIDIIVYGSGEVDSVCVDCLGYDHWAEVRLTAIWLPRQDQLQEMVIAFWKEQDCINKYTVLVDEFYQFVFEKEIDYTMQFKSMEQLWLAFVMLTIYNKKWIEKDWIIQKVAKK